MRAGCAASSKATTCYTYADGGPLEWGKDTVLHAHRMHCACVADTSHAAYSGCNKCDVHKLAALRNAASSETP